MFAPQKDMAVLTLQHPQPGRPLPRAKGVAHLARVLPRVRLLSLHDDEQLVAGGKEVSLGGQEGPAPTTAPPEGGRRAAGGQALQDGGLPTTDLLVLHRADK